MNDFEARAAWHEARTANFPIEERLTLLAEDARRGAAFGGKSLAVVLYEAEARIRLLKRQRAFLWRTLFKALGVARRAVPLRTGQVAAFSVLRRIRRVERS